MVVVDYCDIYMAVGLFQLLSLDDKTWRESCLLQRWIDWQVFLPLLTFRTGCDSFEVMLFISLFLCSHFFDDCCRRCWLY